MTLHALGLSAFVCSLVLAGCTALSGIDGFTFDGAGGGGGAAPGGGGDAPGGGDASGDGGDAPGGGDASGGGDPGCDGEPCPVPHGVAVADQTFTALRGNVGAATPLTDICPGGQVILGFRGSLGALGESEIHGKLQAQCGHLELAGAGPYTIPTAPGDATPVEGTYGATAWEVMCPEGEVVVGFRGRAGSYLDQLALDCAPLLVTGAPGALRVEIGPLTPLDAVGGRGGSEFPATRCGVYQVANAVHVIVASGAIGAFGLGCATVSLTY